MTYVVTGRCVGCRFTDCVTVCPVNCFWEIEQPHMLVIDPDTCVDCNACVSVCPVNAIYPDHELPPEYADWLAFNAANHARGVHRIEGTEPLPTARLLEEIQAEEQAKGWAVAEPSSASRA